MATILRDGNRYTIGKDFVDAATLDVVCSGGAFQHSGYGAKQKTFAWQSSLSQQETERVLRQAAQEDGVQITYFESHSA